MRLFPLVMLGRDPALLRMVADWRLPGVDLHAYESPSEALARLADGRGALLLFDTAGYSRSRHVIRKFLSLPGDADLVLLGEPALVTAVDGARPTGDVVRLDPGAPTVELRAVVERQLRLRAVRQRSGIVGRSRAVAGVHRAHRPGGAAQRQHPDPGGERHRQGAGGPRHPRPLRRAAPDPTSASTAAR